MINSKRRTLFWRGGLACVAVLIAWKIITINLSDHYVTLALAGDSSAIETALFWDGTHPKALTMKARRLVIAGQDEEAVPLLVTAVQRNPADARPLVLLADIRRRRGDITVADQMIETADQLMPVHDKVQRGIAGYWAERGRLDRAVIHLSRTLSADPEARAEDFPVLLRIAQDDSVRQVLAPLADDPPNWWGGFFHYATRNAENIDTVRALMAMREASSTAGVSVAERNAYIDRLRRDGLVAEAYLHWVNGLDAEGLRSLGYLFDGDFEREFSNSGFGWYTRPSESGGIHINTAATYGVEGQKALSIRFSGKRERFNHVYQRLFLPPGAYTVSGRVRPDKLKARRGLQWLVYCSVGNSNELGESELFLGGGDWRGFEFDIQVPPDCGGQLLRLQSAGSRDVDHDLQGHIWFDAMRIELRKEDIVSP